MSMWKAGQGRIKDCKDTKSTQQPVHSPNPRTFEKEEATPPFQDEGNSNWTKTLERKQVGAVSVGAGVPSPLCDLSSSIQ